MITKTKQIANGVKLTYVKTNKFKTNYVSINFISSLSKEYSCYNSILPSVLMRGTKKRSRLVESQREKDMV